MTEKNDDDAQSQAPQEGDECVVWVDYCPEADEEDLRLIEQHDREQWQAMRDQHIARLPFEWAIDASFEDQQQRRDARAGLDEWPGL